MAPQKGTLLSTTDFPLYAVRSLGDRHFLVAGGGGPAKTGVPNAIDTNDFTPEQRIAYNGTKKLYEESQTIQEIFELKLSQSKVLASSLCRHDTGLQAVMNCDTFYDGRNHYLATGQDDECHTYSLKYKVISPDKKTAPNGNPALRKRKGDDSKPDKPPIKHVTFEIDQINQITTDFEKDSSFQKVVRFSEDQCILATGGADGCLRVWKYSDLTKVHEVKAHTNDIDDLDISPCGKYIVTVSRDNTGCVWQAKDGKKISNLVVKYHSSEQYRFRCCRYGVVEGNKGKCNLYTTSIPCKRSSKPLPCFITMWEAKKFSVKKNVPAGTEVLSSLAISDDGTYLGVGTISGDVSVYITFSLQRLYHVAEAHNIFVTGVEFMPSSEGAKAVTGGQDFTLLSISADNSIKVHQVAPPGSINVAWLVAGMLAIIFTIFWLMSSLGL